MKHYQFDFAADEGNDDREKIENLYKLIDDINNRSPIRMLITSQQAMDMFRFSPCFSPTIPSQIGHLELVGTLSSNDKLSVKSTKHGGNSVVCIQCFVAKNIHAYDLILGGDHENSNIELIDLVFMN